MVLISDMDLKVQLLALISSVSTDSSLTPCLNAVKGLRKLEGEKSLKAGISHDSRPQDSSRIISLPLLP